MYTFFFYRCALQYNIYNVIGTQYIIYIYYSCVPRFTAQEQAAAITFILLLFILYSNGI